jgi:hypothetical protein
MIEAFGRNTFAQVDGDVDLPLLLLQNETIGPSVIRRAGWPGQFLRTVAEDHDAYRSMVESAWLGVNLPEVVYDDRVRQGSLDHSATPNKMRIIPPEGYGR